MDFRRVFSILSFLLICLSGTLLLPMGVSYLYGEPETLAFLWSFLLCGVIGGVGYLLSRSGKQEISHREGFAIVGLGWVTVCLLGAVPYLFAGTFPNFLDAFFESSSGFTTTGATVLDDIEVLLSYGGFIPFSSSFMVSLSWQLSWKHVEARLGGGYSGVPGAWLLQAFDISYRFGGKTRRQERKIRKGYRQNVKSLKRGEEQEGEE